MFSYNQIFYPKAKPHFGEGNFPKSRAFEFNLHPGPNICNFTSREQLFLPQTC